ncbi:helix-hairpin-helix domain-containing protein [Verticiella sediminum]|uniref:Helix-hairpin-helix domain-containing protein n=1 Tax=Verticiella sediminum TaxID=1247510 RepID=A0A556AWA7_9BURK|nr:helix-hairpin-helix domain-containing protein [Verticiella sediminum]TSH96655.1 helix-hairpin-helix domain-containing protein [Verticiella sediminum]
MNPFFAGTRPVASHLQTSAVSHPAAGRAMRRFYRAARALALAAGVGLSAGAMATPIDANTASAAELEAVKGIGPRTANLIVGERERSGPFLSLQDFTDRIRGIGPKRAEALQAAGLVVGAKPAAAAASAAPASAAPPAGRDSRR